MRNNTSSNSKINYEKTAEMLRAMSNPKRLQILHLLSSKEMSVNEISEAIGTRKSNTSQHLFILRMLGLVIHRREGKNMFYKITELNIIESILNKDSQILTSKY